jgi:hypothetical protein
MSTAMSINFDANASASNTFISSVTSPNIASIYVAPSGWREHELERQVERLEKALREKEEEETKRVLEEAGVTDDEDIDITDALLEAMD